MLVCITSKNPSSLGTSPYYSFVKLVVDFMRVSLDTVHAFDLWKTEYEKKERKKKN